MSGRRILLLMLGLAALATGFGAPWAARAQTVIEMAVTVDDLPWVAAGRAPAEAVRTGTSRLLDALAARGVVATGFVICDGMEAQPGIVESWQAADHSVASHSGRHQDLNTAALAVWLEDIRRCDRLLRELGGPVRYFRYLLLHEGPTEERRRAAVRLLHELGYRNAPVSVDNAEWVVAEAWAVAEAQADADALDEIRAIYVEHMRRAIAHARETALARFGRDVRHVLLIHANALNAANLGLLLDTLARDGARFVPLDSALADPVYAQPADYTGPCGLSWLYRVEPAAPELAAWDTREEERVRAALAGVVRTR
ncbi:MAG: polysaccharide deacetylase family protein [Gemmatimonadetes bacterium]|nr:polysaccharide deacetylase family protein [Gemmatimonadota bacterium]